MSKENSDSLYQLAMVKIRLYLKQKKSDEITEEDINHELRDAVSEVRSYSAKLTEKDIQDARRKILANVPVYEEPGIMISEENDKWFSSNEELDRTYWERYEEYLFKDKQFPQKTIDTLGNEILPTITDHLGDPTCAIPFSKKGLVIGNIQSGKTSNYIGLMCNAADGGYKVIILLSGTIENLRRQTQTRVNEGFIGFDQAKNETVGVGFINSKAKYPVAMTTTENDFVATADSNSFIHQIDHIDLPYVFVIKKNVKVLERLYKYLCTAIHVRDGKINVPLLLIDDEADNASINTKDDDLDPTKTNESIRKILSLFSQSTYVGYTATPFANVFILPSSKDALKQENLFPKDFIYFLDAPKADPEKEFNSAHYIGPDTLFSNNDSDPNNKRDTAFMIQEINDEDPNLFAMNHKKDVEITSLFPSFYESIRTFLLANVIRDLRGDKTSHRSMLINMSRYISVQKKIADLVDEFLKETKSEVKNSYALPYEMCMSNPTMQEIHRAWDDQYAGKVEFDWQNDILPSLYSSIREIKTVVVNSANKDKLKYNDYKEKGLRVIAVGGLALSRGLTLEGLVISYFYRNTQTYDVLMQMGRWFGYRPGYADICRLWITDESCDWYSKVNLTINKLRDDVYVLNNTVDAEGNPWTPLSFGIRVWYASNDLGLYKKAKITAANKMHNTEERTLNNSYFGLVPETRYFSLDETGDDNKHVIEALEKLVTSSHLIPQRLNEVQQRFGAQNVPTILIKSFLKDISKYVDRKNAGTGFDSDQIIAFLDKNSKDASLQNFDVVFCGGSSDETIKIPGTSVLIKPSVSSFDVKKHIVRLRGVHTRLGSKFDTNVYLKSGLDKDDILNTVHAGNLDETFFLKYRDKPLLLIYFLQLSDALLKPEQDEKTMPMLLAEDNKCGRDFYERMRNQFLVGVAVAFQDDGLPHHQESYIVNIGADYFDNKHNRKNDDIDEIADSKESE